MKKITSLLLAALLAIFSAACGDTQAPKDTTAETEAVSEETEDTDAEAEETDAEGAVDLSDIEGADAYQDQDLSEHVDLIWYVLGDVPPDLDIVLEEANSKYFEPVLNATLEVKFMSWSAYTTKYPLILAGGEESDMIYTASWCYFLEEAQKGAFYELTEEFRAEYLPQASVNQAPESWEQVSVDGKVYAVTRNFLTMPNYKFMAIRDDLRTKYDLPEVSDFASFETYVTTIAENEPGIEALAAPGNNNELREILLLQENGIYMINQNQPDFTYHGVGDLSDIPTGEDVDYLYHTDEFRDYALLMKEWGEKGVWSKNAINSTISTADAFAQGQSATLPWVEALFSYGQRLEAAELGEAAYVDITRQITPRKTSYNGDAIAITGVSKNPERAAMAIDFMMNNDDLNLLLYSGIKGKHYIMNDDNTYTEGPDAEKHSWGVWAWPLVNDNHPKKAGRDARELAIVDDIRAREVSVPIDSFVFDESNVKAEFSVLVSLREEYRPSFDLGAFGDNTEAKLDEYFTKQEDAGLEKVLNEFRTQYDAYLEAKGLN